MKIRLSLFVALLALAMPAMSQLAIGQWRDHFSFNQAKLLAYGDGKLFCAYNLGISSYNESDQTITRYTTATGLTDVAPVAIAYSRQTATLVVAYQNSNIDLIDAYGGVCNIPDVKRSSNYSDKAINAIATHGYRAYLATNFGIVVVDISRCEIQATYTIGSTSSALQVSDVVITDTLLYAATPQGVYCARLADQHLNIPSHWSLVGPTAGVDVSKMLLFGDRLLLLSPDDATTSTLLAVAASEGVYLPLLSGSIENVRVDGNRLMVVYADSIAFYDEALQWLSSITAFAWGNLALHDALRAASGSLYLAHDWAGLVERTADGALTALSPQGQVSDNAYNVYAYRHRTFVAPGGMLRGNGAAYIPANLYIHNGSQWDQLSRTSSVIDTAYDLLSVAVNPRDTTQVYAALWNYGLVRINGLTPVVLYNESNSPIRPYIHEGFRSVRTGAVAFDIDGSLWAIVSMVDSGLVSLSRDGKWSAFYTEPMVQGDEITHLLVDTATGYKWFYSTNGNKLYVHDGMSNYAYVDPNYGAQLETSAINCLVQDHDGLLWMGTNKGIKVIYNTYKAFYNGGEGEKAPISCSNIVITNGEINEYLMAYEDITCIAVDGANRKWVGTESSGIYLISASGDEELLHFTTQNSPLPSNHIVSVCVQPVTGEVFVATDKGTVGYRSEATDAKAVTSAKIHVFPNPVRPDYDGPIAISGFTTNALVHITDVAGHTLFSTQAYGGQALWYGRTNSGEHVASGVYYVFASDNEGTNRLAAKVLVIR